MFDLSDPAERRACDWVRRFHAADSIYRLLDIARATGRDGQGLAVMLTRSQPKRPGAKLAFDVITFDIGAVSVTFQPCATLDAARAAFSALVSTIAANPHALAAKAGASYE